jgi:hypothetical protein
MPYQAGRRCFYDVTRMPSVASPRDRRHLEVLIAVVLTNYLAQIPYTLHLYGLTPNPRGVLLLGATLLWFAAGTVLLLRARRVGYWLVLSFLAAELAFYFRNEIMLIPAGYGLPYHLAHTRDALLWVVFLIGDLNFVAAAYFVWYLLVPRSSGFAGTAEQSSR